MLLDIMSSYIVNLEKLSVEVLHLILCEEKAQSQAKTSFFQFLGHNVPINSSS